MERHRYRKVFIICLSLLLIMTNIGVITAATNQKVEVLQPQKLGKVVLKEGVTAEVNNLVLMPSDQGQTVGFTLTVNNNSNSTVDFIDYWVNLISKSGTKYTVNLVNKDSNKIAAKSSVDILFYSTVGKNVKITDLIVQVIKWDFSASSYSRVLGSLSVPSRFVVPVPAGKGRIVTTENTKISLVVNSATIGKSDKYFRPDLKVTIKNEGNVSLVLPEYELSILTTDNKMYPLTTKQLKGINLAPLAEKEIQLSASIPIAVKEGNWKLAVNLPINEGKNKFPVAIFELPKPSVVSGDQTGKYYTYITSNGIYNIRLDSINRVPLQDNDLIVSNLTIANKSNESLPAPNLIGKIKLNNSIEKEVFISTNSKVLSIPPGQTINLQAVGSVPYTLEIDKVNLTIQQKESGNESESETLDLVEFTHSGKFEPIAVINRGAKYETKDVGSRANISVQKARTFIGSNTDIVAVEIKVENLEKRITDTQKLDGYFEASDGTVFPATFQNITEKVAPKSNALIYAWATLPKETDQSNLKVVIGKAVETVAGEKTQSLGYVNPQAYILPIEEQAQNSLKDIDLNPYTFTISRIATQIKYGENKVVLDFDYNLLQDLQAKTSLKDQKVIVEIVDSSKKAVYTKELSIIGLTPEPGENALKVGKNSIILNWTDENLVANIYTLKDFELNIYQQIQPGYKKLIATNNLPWFVNRTIES